MRNKVLNILAWIVFALSVVAYFADEIPVEACYLGLAAIFLVIAPRHVAEAFN
jgi:hypothetical protein